MSRIFIGRTPERDHPASAIPEWASKQPPRLNQVKVRGNCAIANDGIDDAGRIRNLQPFDTQWCQMVTLQSSLFRAILV